MRARRALLYVPGDDKHKIEKATALGVDCICMDMEDGVAANRKQQARQTIAEALLSLDFGRAERLVRINAVGSGLEEADLQIVLAAHPQGVVIPKVGSGDQISWASARIAEIEKEYGWPVGQIGLIALVESARAVIDLRAIAGADPRLCALIFGAEDLAGDIGALRTAEAWEVFYARSAVVTHAAAFGLQAIDMVNIDFRNLDRLKAEALMGARMGFSGKQVIHPDQIEPVQLAFTPDDQAIARAKHVLELFADYQKAGKGAFAIDGIMVDAPLIRAAERVLARAAAAGKIDPAEFNLSRFDQL